MKNNPTNNAGFSKIMLIGILLAVFLIIIGLAALLSLGRNQQFAEYVAAGNKFITHLSSNEANESYFMLTERLRTSVGNETEWQETVEQSLAGQQLTYKLESAASVPEAEFSYFVGQDPVRLIYSVKLGNSDKYDMYLVVLKENDSLKIDEFNSSPGLQ